MKALEIIAYIAAVLFTLSIAERWYSARRTDREAASHCATLDAIAVQTPEGWMCITASVIPADSGTESVTEP